MLKHQSKQWADAVVTIILENDKYDNDKARKEALLIVKVFERQADILKLLRSPGISLNEKLEIIDKVFKGFNPIFINTIKLMTEKLLPKHIADAFHKVYIHISKEIGILTGVIETSKELSEQDINKVEEYYSGIKHKKVELLMKINPTLVHGVKVTVDGEIYDGSLHGRIQSIRNTLIK